MTLFFRHATRDTARHATDGAGERSRAFAPSMTQLVETLCDEELLAVH